MDKSKINFAHLLTPNQVNSIREFCSATEFIQTFENLISTNVYLQLLITALQTFMSDNAEMDSVHEGKATMEETGVTESDLQLYTQLISMYKDYLMRLSSLKTEEKFQNKDLIKYDYLDLNVFPKLLLESDPKNVNNNYVLQVIEITHNRELAKKFKINDGNNQRNEQIEGESSDNEDDDESSSDDDESSDDDNESGDDDESGDVKRVEAGKKLESQKITTKRTSSQSIESDKIDKNVNKRQKLEQTEKPSVPSSSSSSSLSSSSLQSNISGASTIKSILKDTTSNDSKSKRGLIKKKQLSFNTESVTVFGDDLPKKGRVVSVKDLKIALNNEKKPSPPREKVLIDISSIKVLKIKDSTVISSIPDCDISELKGGVVKLESSSKPEYRRSFKNYNKNLNREHTEKEFHSQTENFPDLNSYPEPIVMPAFGQNELLLQQDRGRLPYKPVPEVRVNNYPPISRS